MSASGAPQNPSRPRPASGPSLRRASDPATLFLARSRRLRALASDRPLKPYLGFITGLTDAQHNIQPGLPAARLPAPGKSSRHSRAVFRPSHALPWSRRGCGRHHAPVPSKPLRYGAGMGGHGRPASAGGSFQRNDAAVHGRGAERRSRGGYRGAGVRARGAPVHISRLAAQLSASELKPLADGACPVCGSPPMISSVVAWPNAQNSRYCTCPLCATMWKRGPHQMHALQLDRGHRLPCNRRPARNREGGNLR